MHHWPVAMWGFNLGCMVHNIRNRSHQLDTAQLDDLIDVGFVFDARTGVWEGKILAARPVFAHERGHARVPQGFIVPAYEPWPKLAWGMRLGSAVARVHQGSVSEHAHRDADKLDAIGFVWSVTDDTWREAILPSLEMFHQREGHCHVPSGFTVPRGDLWPRRAWGMARGTVVNNSIRNRGDYAAQREQDRRRLEAIGFPAFAPDDRWIPFYT